MSTKLYVGNLPFETNESELQALFQGAGEVSTINIVRDRSPRPHGRRARGGPGHCAFVEMSNEEEAQPARSANSTSTSWAAGT